MLENLEPAKVIKAPKDFRPGVQFDGNEGTATGVEEMFMHAGLYDDNPRSREIVWIMLAQRAARGLGSLYAQANEMTMEEAGSIHMNWTPRGWMKTEPELRIFEQHLYLRQPGYYEYTARIDLPKGKDGWVENNVAVSDLFKGGRP